MAKESWGGNWTEQKLKAFEKYVGAYLTIMNKHRDKFGWKLIYFDAFAGSGTRKTIQERQNLEPLFSITDEEISVYKGAAERVVSIKQRGFDVYYFIEKDEKAKKELEERLNPLNPGKILNFQFRAKDANEQLLLMAEAMKNNKTLYSLALLDPFGMQVNWSSIEKLSGTNTDLWILIPSGVIINRLLDNRRKLPHMDRLVSYFGLPEDEIKKYFYEERSRDSLFEIETTQYQKVSEPIRKITELYIHRLGGIFKEVTRTPLALRNSKNVPIYHFAFASNKKVAKGIATQIIGRAEK